MFTRTVGTVSPVWAPDGEGDGGAAAAAAAAAEAAGGGEPKADGGGAADDKGFVFDAGKAYEGLEADNLGWLQKNEALLKDPKALAKHAFNQEKLLGNAIRIPGKDATPEEREAFLNKLGRPEKPDGYQFTVPKDLPEGLPYDGERAKAFAAKAHALGIPQDAAAGLHDWFMQDSVNAFKGMGEASAAAMQERGAAETEKLVKEWGPLEGDTARANFEIADKVFTQVPGGPEFLAELQSLKLVGPNKEILSAPVAKMLAALGTALYTEDGVLRGKADVIGNPFDKKGTSFNLTSAMQIAKEDPDRARSLITAAGGKPDEWGLKAS
jgi:hypothetical protein